MKIKSYFFACVLGLGIIHFSSSEAVGQIESAPELSEIIKEKDSLLFDIGFNTCAIEVLEELISERFAFYHDQSGITNGRNAFIESVENGLCKLPYQALRRLEENSSSIFPLKDQGDLYGAIQHGIHRFFAKEPGKDEYITSVAQFTHVWIIEDGSWKLSAVLSYDHKEK